MNKRILAIAVLAIFILAPAAYASSISDVARIKQKGYVEYAVTFTYSGVTINATYIYKYINYTEISSGIYNVTFEEDIYVLGGWSNETTQYTRDFNNCVFVGTEENNESVPFYDQNRHNEAINHAKENMTEMGLNVTVTSGTFTVSKTGKTYHVDIIVGENSTHKTVIYLGKYIGVVLYLHEEKKDGSASLTMKVVDTNLEEEVPSATGGEETTEGEEGGISTAVLAGIIAVVVIVVLALLYFLMAKKKGA